MEIETKFVNESLVKMPIELQKPDTKFRKAETEADAARKKYYEAEPESIKNGI